MGTLSDRIPWLNQVRWGWLGYALWSNASNTSVQSARLTNIHLSASAVTSVASAITHCYPPSIMDQITPDQSIYGFVEVQEGTKLRVRGIVEGEVSSAVALQGFRCRARCAPSEMGEHAEMIVPGYGVCDLPGGDQSRFITEDLKPRFRGGPSTGLQSLVLEFFQIESPALISELLNLIGGKLRSLRMGMFWTGRRRSVVLEEVAAACPSLEELYLTDFDVVLSSNEGLHSWGLQKLVIHGSDVVVDLVNHLSDPICRMSRELELLEISVPRSVQYRATYVSALSLLNGDYLSATKERFPLGSKAAMISVVDYKSDVKVSAVHRLNEIMMGYIFEFAATPKRRLVRVNAL
ncbi:unnamed protein product [Phytophthora fragariaefolia]|uniref:Unnamed protein product n=1 Tax=Phytophthora fragariaefolia TaxID=1490495 RepID=A0A9W6XJ24_9STRA|nr:unnamed protein product [Phytophthora fragariaefolia]